MTAWVVMVRGNRSRSKRGSFMAETVTHSLVQQFASMKPNEFGPTIEPKWQACERLVQDVRASVEKKQLTPLDGARVISSITATLFGYDEFILREFSPESLLSTTSNRRKPACRGRGAVAPLPSLAPFTPDGARRVRHSVAGDLQGVLLVRREAWFSRYGAGGSRWRPLR